MNKYYRNYFWKDGIPYGIDAINKETEINDSYKIVMDPYRKRISIEKYTFGEFSKGVYDSALLNFRKLNLVEQLGWQKMLVKENQDSQECIIRDQDDRVLFIETYTFHKNYCKKCIATSPQGIVLSIQEMFYKILGDKENEVILYDSNRHPVLHKTYNADPVTGEFTTLIKELTNMRIE